MRVRIAYQLWLAVFVVCFVAIIAEGRAEGGIALSSQEGLGVQGIDQGSGLLEGVPDPALSDQSRVPSLGLGPVGGQAFSRDGTLGHVIGALPSDLAETGAAPLDMQELEVVALADLEG